MREAEIFKKGFDIMWFQVYNEHKNCEVDPSKLKSDDCLESNKVNLLSFLSLLSPSSFHSSLILLQQTAMAYEDAKIKNYVFSGKKIFGSFPSIFFEISHRRIILGFGIWHRQILYNSLLTHWILSLLVYSIFLNLHA